MFLGHHRSLNCPEYCYNDIKKNPNWVSWQLNKTWLGEQDRTNAFDVDRILPNSWQKVQAEGDITKIPNNLNDSPAQRSTDGQAYDRGHLIPSEDRTRNLKENELTFLMSNMIPQNQRNNENPTRWWQGLERFSRNLVNAGKELYIIAGGTGTRAEISSPQGFKINVPDRLWKVVLVLDKPGQGISDVTSSTMAFALDIPNIDPATDTQINPTSWKDYVVSVQDLEDELKQDGFDFLSNIPDLEEELIENRLRQSILQWIDTVLPTAPLMSGESLGLVSADTTSGQYRFTEDSTRASTINVKPRSLTEVGMAQISSSEASFLQEGFGKVGITEIGIKEGSLQTIALSQVGFSQISLNEASGFQSSFTQIGITEVGSLEIGSSQVAATQIGISQDDSSQIFVSQANTLQINTTKVSLPSSVTLQQFLSSHNFSLQNTTIPTWTEFLAGTTPFNLNIEITDRPTGQLAVRAALR
jgi:endonuclease G, mitochondrial